MLWWRSGRTLLLAVKPCHRPEGLCIGFALIYCMNCNKKVRIQCLDRMINDKSVTTSSDDANPTSILMCSESKQIGKNIFKFCKLWENIWKWIERKMFSNFFPIFSFIFSRFLFKTLCKSSDEKNAINHWLLKINISLELIRTMFAITNGSQCVNAVDECDSHYSRNDFYCLFPLHWYINPFRLP